MKKIQHQNKLKKDKKINPQDEDSLIRTKEVLSDKDIMSQIKQGKKKNVKARDFEEVANELEL